MLLEPPVTPDAPTAHRWAVEELSDPAYHQSENLLVRLLRWLLQQFQGLPALGVSPALAALLVYALRLARGREVAPLVPYGAALALAGAGFLGAGFL